MARKPDALGFRSFVVFFWSEFKRLEKNDKTKKFIGKLDNCIKKIRDIINLMDSELNAAENTMNVISETLTSGLLRWEISDSLKCEFSVKIPSLKDESINLEKLTMHCSRSILLSATKKIDPKKEQT